MTTPKHDNVENIIMISFDSLRADYVGDLTAKEAPHFARLKSGGAYFPKTIVQAPFTVPSHLAMLTGMYPARTGVRDMHHQVPSGTKTIFRTLKENGVSTLASSSASILNKMGFEGVDRFVPFRVKRIESTIKALSGRFFVFIHYWGTHTPYETRLPIDEPTDLLLNATRFADKLSNARFLRRISERLWLARVERIRYLMRQDSRKILPNLIEGYKRAIRTADNFTGRVLGLMERTGVAEDTLLVVTGDHGDSFNEHGEIETAEGGRHEHGQFLYDNVTNVPLMFYWPGRDLSRTFEHQVLQVDIVPTLLAAMNIETDISFDGRELWADSILRGLEPEDRLAFSEVVRESLDIELRSVRSNRSKLIRDYRRSSFEMFDLEADPGELSDIYASCSEEQVGHLRAGLDTFSAMETKAEESLSDHERKQVDDLLRNLGYID